MVCINIQARKITHAHTYTKQTNINAFKSTHVQVAKWLYGIQYVHILWYMNICEYKKVGETHSISFKALIYIENWRFICIPRNIDLT